MIDEAQYPDDDWIPGPPHVFSGPKGAAKDARCAVCDCRKDRAIHSAEYWAKERQLALLTPEAFLAWKVAHGR